VPCPRSRGGKKFSAEPLEKLFQQNKSSTDSVRV
jgi:hypothetical protein